MTQSELRKQLKSIKKVEAELVKDKQKARRFLRVIGLTASSRSSRSRIKRK